MKTWRKIGGWALRRTTMGKVAMLGAFGVFATACVFWSTWDVKFKSSHGWFVGDGMYSIALPGNRHYFFFGDSLIFDSGHTRDQDFEYSLAGGIVDPVNGGLQPDMVNSFLLGGNTAAIVQHEAATPWVPGEIKFYARTKTGSGSCFDSDDNFVADNCPLVDLANPAEPYVNEQISNAGGFVPRKSETSDPYFWPKDAVYIENPDDVPSGYQLGGPLTDVDEPFMAMAFTQAGPCTSDAMCRFGTCDPIAPGSDTKTCSTPSWGMIFATNIHEPIEGWQIKGRVHRAEHPMGSDDGDEDGLVWSRPTWANAFVHAEGWPHTLVYGQIQQRETFDVRLDAILAKAVYSADLTQPDRWEYLYKPNTEGCGAEPCFRQREPTSASRVDNLFHVAERVYNDYSVDYMCHTEPAGPYGGSVDACGYVMVHGTFPANVEGNIMPPVYWNNGHPACEPVTWLNPRWGMVRSSDTYIFPGPQHHSQGNKSTYLGTEDALINIGWDWEVLCFGYPNIQRRVRQLRGHDNLSEEGNIFVSWYIGGQWPESTISPFLWLNGDYDEPTEAKRQPNGRFGKFPLSYLQPWCRPWGTCPQEL